MSKDTTQEKTAKLQVSMSSPPSPNAIKNERRQSLPSKMELGHEMQVIESEKTSKNEKKDQYEDTAAQPQFIGYPQHAYSYPGMQPMYYPYGMPVSWQQYQEQLQFQEQINEQGMQAYYSPYAAAPPIYYLQPPMMMYPQQQQQNQGNQPPIRFRSKSYNKANQKHKKTTNDDDNKNIVQGKTKEKQSCNAVRTKVRSLTNFPGPSGPLVYKTEICPKILNNTFCPKQEGCEYAHSIHELRPRDFDPYYKTEKCRNYQLHGICKFKNQCKYIHDEYRIRGENQEVLLVCPSENIVRVELVQDHVQERMKFLEPLIRQGKIVEKSPVAVTEKDHQHQPIKREKPVFTFVKVSQKQRREKKFDTVVIKK